MAGCGGVGGQRETGGEWGEESVEMHVEVSTKGERACLLSFGCRLGCWGGE